MYKPTDGNRFAIETYKIVSVNLEFYCELTLNIRLLTN